MSGFDGFLGNKRLISMLVRDINAGRTSHAYIIEGGEGCGKRTLAKLIASAISCESGERPCMKCLTCDKIAREQSPDVSFIEAESGKVQLGVDVIRKLREDSVYAPNDLSKRFFIIPKADTMNTAAQNALLKILEEPPSYLMFLILCENADNLLSTIRSRAPILRLESLSDDTVAEYVKNSSEAAAELFSASPHEFNAAIKLSQGSIGTALKLTSKENAAECLEIYKKAEGYMERLASRSTPLDDLAFYEYAVKLANSKQREALCEIYGLICSAVRDLINIKLTKSPQLIFYTSEKTASHIAESFTIGRLMALVEIFEKARESVMRNVNIGLSQASAACMAVSAGKSRRSL